MPKTVNGVDGAVVQNYLNRITAGDETVATIMSEAMKKAKEVREEQREILEELEGNGIPKVAFKTLVKLDRKRRALVKAFAKVNADIADEVHALQASVDWDATPLGEMTLRPNAQASAEEDEEEGEGEAPVEHAKPKPRGKSKKAAARTVEPESDDDREGGAAIPAAAGSTRTH